MAEQDTNGTEMDVSGTWVVPAFTDVTDVSEPGDASRSYVISNSATGKYFLANDMSVHLLNALRQTGQVAAACAAIGLPVESAGTILKRFIDFGLIAKVGETRAVDVAPSSPIESRMIMMRWDFLDLSRSVERLSLIGRFAFSRLGFFAWLAAMAVMIFQLLDNPEKVRITMLRVLDFDLTRGLIFLGLIIVLKLIHEYGHAFAYREMMRQEGLQTGPIRAGICVFAFTPFPFTDVSAAWRLRSRARRVMIGAGGIYFESWAMAALTLFWAQTQTGVFQTVALQTAVISGALALLFNLNPAIKLDGYFMLTDWLRKPNLAGRASHAARSFVARLLGATNATSPRAELLYWLLSYLYRWTIFAGIFWLVYQFDPRLGPLIAGVVVMMLLIRPMIATAKFVRMTDARPWRSLMLVSGLVGLAYLTTIPFQGRLLIDGNMVRADTRFITVTEPGWLRDRETGLSLENPNLQNRITDLEIHKTVLAVLERARFDSSTEQSRLRDEKVANADALQKLRLREAQLDLGASDGEWSDLGANAYLDAWLTPRSEPIAAVSQATAPHVQLFADQRRLTDQTVLTRAAIMTVRAHLDPDCTFTATPDITDRDFVATNGRVRFTANFDADTDPCVHALPHGAPLVARLQTPPLSLFNRVLLLASRSLQDRLDVTTNN